VGKNTIHLILNEMKYNQRWKRSLTMARICTACLLFSINFLNPHCRFKDI